MPITTYCRLVLRVPCASHLILSRFLFSLFSLVQKSVSIFYFHPLLCSPSLIPPLSLLFRPLPLQPLRPPQAWKNLRVSFQYNDVCAQPPPSFWPQAKSEFAVLGGLADAGLLRFAEPCVRGASGKPVADGWWLEGCGSSRTVQDMSHIM